MSKNKLKTEEKEIVGRITINDLRKLDYDNVELSPQQRLALKNFDRYKVTLLNSQTNKEAFDQKNKQLQVLANLSPYEEFLKEVYF